MKKLIFNVKGLTPNAKRLMPNAERNQVPAVKNLAFRLMHSAFSVMHSARSVRLLALSGMLLAFSLFAISCSSNNDSYKKAEDAQDAGRLFIRASLDGDYDKAAFYLLRDSTNQLLFEKQQMNYGQLSSKEKSSYKNASIRPVAITPENDSTVLYKYYHTSNPSDTTTLRIIRHNGDWLVDLKSVIKM